MDKRLEQRIKRLEKVMSRKNEQLDDPAEAVYRTANQISESHDRDELQLKAMRAVEALSKAADLVSQVAIALDYDDNTQTQEWQSLEYNLNGMIKKLNKLSFRL